MSITISVIIPVYNRLIALEELLRSLSEQTYKLFEIIIINDGSTEFAASQLESITGKYDHNIRIITQQNGGRSIARNNGVKNSENELIIFVDSDMILEPSFIEKHLKFHETNGANIYIGSGYRNPKDVKNDFDKYVVYVENYWKSITIESEEVNFDNFIFTSCNMSILKKDFYAINGFDEKLKDAEDFDFGIRALQRGIKINYNRNTIAWHNDWTNITQFINRHCQYTEAKNKLTKIHPEYLKLFPVLLATKDHKLKSLILKMAKQSICKMVISDFYLFKILPLKLKFYFYKLTIAAYSKT